MKFKLLKNEHGAVITHVALALSGIEREDAAQLTSWLMPLKQN